MNLEKVSYMLQNDDGSLPDIDFDFQQKPVVGEAYALIQAKATRLVSKGAYYWSKSRNKEIPISFGDNPALALQSGDAEPFHVVFGGLQSATGAPIPDLGVFVLGEDLIALDYRMGTDWNESAICGLFDVMLALKMLSASVKISHTGNIYESEEGILLSGFEHWSDVKIACQ